MTLVFLIIVFWSVLDVCVWEVTDIIIEQMIFWRGIVIISNYWLLADIVWSMVQINDINDV